MNLIMNSIDAMKDVDGTRESAVSNSLTSRTSQRTPLLVTQRKMQEEERRPAKIRGTEAAAFGRKRRMQVVGIAEDGKYSSLTEDPDAVISVIGN